jgi:hypothetical protein
MREKEGKMEFYSVKKRKKVDIPEENVRKTTYGKEGRVRYALRGKDDDGTNLTKFVSKETYDSLDVPQE